MSENRNSESLNSIVLIWGDLKRKFFAPTKSFTFYTHLLLAVVAGGGFGIWYALYQAKGSETWDLLAISASLYTYFPAIVATAILEFTHERQPYLRSFPLFSLVPFALLFFLATTTEPEWRLRWASLASILAVLFWWVANGEKEFYRDVLTPDDATGGDVNRELLGKEPENWTR